MVRFCAAVFFACLLLLAPLTAWSEEIPSKDVFIQEFRKMVNSREFLEENNPFPPSSPARLPYQKFTKELLSDEDVLAALYDTINESQGLVKNYRALGKAWAEEISGRGLKRLSANDMEDFLGILNRFAGNISESDCADLFRGNGKVRIQMLENLDEKDLILYLQIMKKAVKAELTRTPGMGTNTEDQGKVANEALGNAILKLVPVEDVQSFLAVAADMQNSLDEDVCWAGRKILDAFVSIKGEPRLWVLREYVKNIE